MNKIMTIADKYNLFVIEDAAQCIGATLNGKQLGTIGHFGTFSFHETKNIHCGEGGALLINDSKFVELAEIMREKGTDRSRFLRGQVDKYSWVSVGSSYLPSEFNAAVLLSQLEQVQLVTKKRKSIWAKYYSCLESSLGSDMLPSVEYNREANGHVFFIKCKDISHRQKLIDGLKEKDIQSVFHYIPLHSAAGGKKYARFNGIDQHTTIESEKLLRLPLHYTLSEEDVQFICNQLVSIY
jgi:dTDP-4-amino-4,6-dideoxygalactose transaminase